MSAHAMGVPEARARFRLRISIQDGGVESIQVDRAINLAGTQGGGPLALRGEHFRSGWDVRGNVFHIVGWAAMMDARANFIVGWELVDLYHAWNNIGILQVYDQGESFANIYEPEEAAPHAQSATD